MTGRPRRATLTIDGVTRPIAEWADDPRAIAAGVTAATIYSRTGHGWDPLRAISTPVARRPSATVVTGRCDDATPWIRDYTARAIVVHRPDGATLEEIGVLFGFSRERARQVMNAGLRKLRAHAAELGIDASELETLLVPNKREPRRPDDEYVWHERGASPKHMSGAPKLACEMHHEPGSALSRRIAVELDAIEGRIARARCRLESRAGTVRAVLSADLSNLVDLDEARRGRRLGATG